MVSKGSRTRTRTRSRRRRSRSRSRYRAKRSYNRQRRYQQGGMLDKLPLELDKHISSHFGFRQAERLPDLINLSQLNKASRSRWRGEYTNVKTAVQTFLREAHTWGDLCKYLDAFSDAQLVDIAKGILEVKGYPDNASPIPTDQLVCILTSKHPKFQKLMIHLFRAYLETTISSLVRLKQYADATLLIEQYAKEVSENEDYSRLDFYPVIKQAPKNDSAFFEFLAWCDVNASHAVYSYYDGRTNSLANSYLLSKHKDSIAEEFAQRVHSVNRRYLVNLWLSPVVGDAPQRWSAMVDILLRVDPTLRDTVDSWGWSRIDHVYDLSKKRVENPFESWEFTDVATYLLRQGVKPSASLKDKMKQYANRDSIRDQEWTPYLS